VGDPVCRGVAGDSHYIYIYTSIATRPGAPDGEQLWDTELRRIDALLEDEVLIERVEQALRCRRPEESSAGPAANWFIPLVVCGAVDAWVRGRVSRLPKPLVGELLVELLA